MSAVFRAWEGCRTFLGLLVLLGSFSAQAIPVVTNINPPYGIAGAQDNIILKGSGLSGATVYFTGSANWVQDPTASAPSQTQINCKVPLAAVTGPVAVVVSGQTFITTNNFVVLHGQPYITSFSPISGQTNTVVSLYGTYLDASTKVWFSGVLAGTPLTGPAIGQIRVQVPAGAVPGSIMASNAFSATYGVFTTSSNFTATGSGPLISNFNPVRGGPGTEVVINGQNFYQGFTTVYFGTNAASAVTFTAGTQIHAWAPANVATAPISVVTPFGTNITSTNFVVGFAPEISGFNPPYGSVGTEVVIFGQNFLTNTTVVKLNGTNVAAVSVISPTQLRATIQNNASSGLFTVSTTFGTNSSASNFVVTGTAPLITSFNPPVGGVNDLIVIHGDNLIDVTNVLFGGIRARAFAAPSRTQLSVLVPTNGLNGPLSVANPFGSATTSSNFYLPPAISSLNPATAPLQGTVGIAGTNLLGATSVRFNGLVADFTVMNNSSIQATVPAKATSGFVTVTTPGGSTSSPQSFPIAPSADLAVGLTIDRNPMIIGESALLSATVTNFGPNPATNVVVDLKVPFFMSIQSASASAGSVTTNSLGGHVVLGVLGVSNTLTLTVKGRANSVASSIAEADGTSSIADLIGVNNHRELTVIVTEAPTLSISQSSPTEVVLSWVPFWTNFTVQSAIQIPATGTWTDLTNVPVVVSNLFQVVQPATNTARYFRLKRAAP